MSSEKLFGCIEIGKRYDINLTEDIGASELLTLGFNFKPANSIDNSSQHSILRTYQNKEAILQTEVEDHNSSAQIFKGIVENGSVVGNEYLLKFEDGSFILQRVNASIRNLRPVREENMAANTQSIEQSKKSITSALKNLKSQRKKKDTNPPPTAPAFPNKKSKSRSTAASSSDAMDSVEINTKASSECLSSQILNES